MGAVEGESGVVGAEQRKAALAGVALEGGLDDGGDDVVLVDNEADGARTTEHGDGDEEPPDGGALLLLGHQHGRKRKKGIRKGERERGGDGGVHGSRPRQR